MTWFVCFVLPVSWLRVTHRRGDNYFTPDVKIHNWRIAGMQSNKQNMNVRKFNQNKENRVHILSRRSFLQHNLVQENDKKERGKGVIVVVIEWMKWLCYYYYYLLRRTMSFTVTVECTFTMPRDGIFFHQTDEWTKQKKQYGSVSMHNNRSTWDKIEECWEKMRSVSVCRFTKRVGRQLNGNGRRIAAFSCCCSVTGVTERPPPPPPQSPQLMWVWFHRQKKNQVTKKRRMKWRRRRRRERASRLFISPPGATLSR